MKSRPPDLWCPDCQKYVELIGKLVEAKNINCKLTTIDGEVLIDQIRVDYDDLVFTFHCNQCDLKLADSLEDLRKQYEKR